MFYVLVVFTHGAKAESRMLQKNRFDYKHKWIQEFKV